MDTPIKLTLMDGVPIQLAGKTWVIPSLSLGQVKRLKPCFDALKSEQLTIEQIDSMITICFSALSRNYPELEEADVEEMFGINDFPVIMDAILQASGLVRQGEAMARQLQ